jgi:HTH-type transcriptional regulator/antitoxin HigA
MKTQIRKPLRFLSYADVPKTYRGLCELYLPRPIRDEEEDTAATEMMNALAVFQRLNAEQTDYLDVLTEFVDAYDKAKPVRWPKVKGLDVLKHLLEEHGLNAADLSRILGASRNLGAMILRGDRNLTLTHIRKLGAHFKVSPELFV